MEVPIPSSERADYAYLTDPSGLWGQDEAEEEAAMMRKAWPKSFDWEMLAFSIIFLDKWVNFICSVRPRRKWM